MGSFIPLNSHPPHTPSLKHQYHLCREPSHNQQQAFYYILAAWAFSGPSLLPIPATSFPQVNKKENQTDYATQFPTTFNYYRRPSQKMEVHTLAGKVDVQELNEQASAKPQM